MVDMKKLLKIVLAAAIVLTAALVPAVPAHADATGCPGPGTGARFCLFMSENYGGLRAQYGTPASGQCINIAAPYNNNAESVRNNLTVDIYIWDDPNCTNHGSLIGPGKVYPWFGSPGQPNIIFKNNISSISRP